MFTTILYVIQIAVLFRKITARKLQVGNEGEIQPVMGRTVPPSQYSLALERNLGPHDPRSLIKCCESLAFLVRDVAHITPYNFDDCVHCIRTFVEASLHGSKFLIYSFVVSVLYTLISVLFEIDI